MCTMNVATLNDLAKDVWEISKGMVVRVSTITDMYATVAGVDNKNVQIIDGEAYLIPKTALTVADSSTGDMYPRR
ncbi:hypothetical protein WH47_10730 [Habropoda laboriosa]|uniref:Uncharacterized protein n=1 Tax=Habropoda laboriosa TaxID=597456 RepID=A0A0L7RCG2_9HYME|nr:hypothetical protein WH47_10730 [Habropoda laboriosa]